MKTNFALFLSFAHTQIQIKERNTYINKSCCGSSFFGITVCLGVFVVKTCSLVAKLNSKTLILFQKRG